MCALRGWMSFTPSTKDFLQDLVQQYSEQNVKANESLGKCCFVVQPNVHPQLIKESPVD